MEEYTYEKEKKVIEAVRNDEIYDYIANHYTEMDRYDLARLVMEFSYELHNVLYNSEYKESLENIATELEDYWIN